MIEDRTGNLLDQSDLTHLIHQCNPFCNFGKGLAAEIKARYPEVYAADLDTKDMPPMSKLGMWSWAKTKDGKHIFNLYSQRGLHATDRVTSYDAMVKGMTSIRDLLQDWTIILPAMKLGVPYKLGCGLANGSWPIVRAIIEDVFQYEKYPVVICRLP